MEMIISGVIWGYSLPKAAGLLAPNALLGWEKSPVAAPVLVLPNRLVVVPPAAPNPKPLVAEDVTGWLKVLDPNRPPGWGTVVVQGMDSG